MNTRTLLAASAIALMATAAQAEKLTVWGLQAFNKDADALIGQMAQDFGKSRGVDVEYVVVPANVLTQRLAAAFEGHAAPDVYMQIGQSTPYYADRGLTKLVDDLLAEMRTVDGGIYESLALQSTYKGVAHSIPLEVDVVPMFARTDLLKTAGMELPKTWEELGAAAKAIVKANPQYTGLGLPVSTANDAESDILMLVWSFGGAMFAEDGSTVTWSSPETTAAYAYIEDLFKAGAIPRSALTWDDAGNNTAYQTGRAAFIMNPASVYSWMVQNDQTLLSNSAMIAIPKGPGPKGRSATMISSFAWMLSSETRQDALAKDWIRYFFQPDNYEKLIEVTGGRWVPIFPKLMQTMPLFKDNPAFASFDDLARNGLAIGFQGPPTPLASEIYNAKVVSTSVQHMLVDGYSPADAVAWATKEIEGIKARQAR